MYIPIQYDISTGRRYAQNIDVDDTTFAPGITNYIVSRDSSGKYVCDGSSDQVEINQAITDLPN